MSGSDLWGTNDDPDPALPNPSHPTPADEHPQDIHPAPLHPDTPALAPSSAEPCVVEGEVDLTRNWYGYLGVFDLRAGTARVYYEMAYRTEVDCCPVNLLFYIAAQVQALHYRMTCLAKVSSATFMYTGKT